MYLHLQAPFPGFGYSCTESHPSPTLWHQYYRLAYQEPKHTVPTSRYSLCLHPMVRIAHHTSAPTSSKPMGLSWTQPPMATVGSAVSLRQTSSCVNSVSTLTTLGEMWGYCSCILCLMLLQPFFSIGWLGYRRRSLSR